MACASRGPGLAEARQTRETLLQPGQHLVQRRTQRFQLARHGRVVEAQVQVLHVDRQGLTRQPAHRAQRAPADQPAEHGCQQRADTQRPPQLGAIGAQHLFALAQQAPGHQRQPRLAGQLSPGQTRLADIPQRHRIGGRQRRNRQTGRVDLDQRAPLGIQQPEQAVAVAQHVLAAAAAGAARRRWRCRPAAPACAPAGRAAPGRRARRSRVPASGTGRADGAEQHHRDEGEGQCQAQAE